MSNYERQKKESCARFRVSAGDAQRVAAGQFTIYDFIDNSFSFSPERKQLAVAVLGKLKAAPVTFNQLVTALKAKKSTLFLLLLALRNSGLVENGGKNAPFRLSARFSFLLSSYAGWWERWVSRQ